MTKLDEFERQMTNFASSLGETKGKLDALDERVAHNCQRNEDNFKLLDDKFDRLNDTIINAMASTNGRVAANETRIAEQIELTHKLSIAVTKRSVALWAIIITMILSFVGGSLINWGKVDQFFEKTTATQRADMVKQGIEAGLETAGKIK